MAVHRVVEPAVLAREVLAAELDAAADVLDAAAVEHQRDQARDVGRGVQRDEAVHQRERRAGPPRRGAALGLVEAAAPAVERRLHRADRRAQHVGDLFEAHVEGVLQHHGGALLRREALQQPLAGVAHGAGRGRGPAGASASRERTRLGCRAAAACRSRGSSPCAAGRRAGSRSPWWIEPERGEARAAACPARGPRRPTVPGETAAVPRGARAAAARRRST